jgi:putative sigma-54 modulation protein
MQVSVSSRHIELSEDVRRAAVEKIGRLDRFLDGLERAEVHFTEEHNPRISERDVCEVTMEGHGHHIRAKVAAPDPMAAVDLAVEKLEQQLHRLKTRLSPKGGASPRLLGAGGEGDVDDDGPSLADEAFVTRAGQEIVKRKSFAIRPLSVDDAVLQLDLLDHDFFFFTSAETGRPAVLYRRASGGLGLIEGAEGP